MKHIRIFLGVMLAASLVAFGLVLRADTPTSASYAPAPASGIAYSYPGNTTFTTDTISDTEADTLLIPTNLLSDLTYNWTITTTELSGTLDITAVVQESNTIGGTPTDWVPVGTQAITADTTVRIAGDRVYGTRQRIILTGSGTQEGQYVLNARFKYPN